MTASNKVTLSAINPAQVRAVRGLLDWTRDKLAAASGVPKRTLVRLEHAGVQSRGSTVAAVREALEEAGVEFIPSNGGGPGVRLRENPI